MTSQLNATCDSKMDPFAIQDFMGTTGKILLGYGDEIIMLYQC